MRFTLRSYLVGLVVAAALPILLLAIALTIAMHRHERATMERGLRDSARIQADALDAELRASFRSLASASRAPTATSWRAGSGRWRTARACA